MMLPTVRREAIREKESQAKRGVTASLAHKED
jgi:hypothetical protein